jgi:hypothetical protein
MKNLSIRFPIILLAGAGLLLPGCAEQREVVAPELTPAMSAAATPTLPQAIYGMTLTQADFPPFFPPEVVEFLSGDWELDLTDPRRSVTRLNGEVVVVGRYTANPARLVMHDTGGPIACLGEPGMAQGIYAWSLVGDQLTLTAVLDRCQGRPFVLTVKPWQKE